MAYDFFLGQTAAEWAIPLPKNAKKAWMACHFSPYGTGLSNLPSQMPPGSMLILNDRTPVSGHDPARIARQLSEVAAQFSCSRILLDLQRPGEAEAAAIAAAVLAQAPCPVGISHWYARELDCAVCLPPQPLHIPLSQHLAPWQSRKIWLELAPDSRRYRITAQGCRIEPCDIPASLPHYDEALCCHYAINTAPEAIAFTLHRSQNDACFFPSSDQIDCFVGLYQEFSQPEAQETALAQRDSR